MTRTCAGCGSQKRKALFGRRFDICDVCGSPKVEDEK